MAKAAKRAKEKPGKAGGFEISSLPTKPLDWFIPYADNPRIHPPAEIDLLAEHLRRFGPDQPIVVDEDRIILKGHGRLEAAGKAGLKTFPYVQRFGLSDGDKHALRIADNQLPLMAAWNDSLLKAQHAELKASGYEIALLGFGQSQLVQFEASPTPPTAFQEFGEDIATEHQCPKCRYRWSGSSKPADAAPQKPAGTRNGKGGKNGARASAR